METSNLLKPTAVKTTINAYCELVSAVELEGKIRFNEQVLYIYSNTKLSQKDKVFYNDSEWEVVFVDECLSPTKYRIEAIKVEKGDADTA